MTIATPVVRGLPAPRPRRSFPDERVGGGRYVCTAADSGHCAATLRTVGRRATRHDHDPAATSEPIGAVRTRCVTGLFVLASSRGTVRRFWDRWPACPRRAHNAVTTRHVIILNYSIVQTKYFLRSSAGWGIMRVGAIPGEATIASGRDR